MTNNLHIERGEGFKIFFPGQELSHVLQAYQLSVESGACTSQEKLQFNYIFCVIVMVNLDLHVVGNGN